MQLADGTWVPVPPRRDAFVVNVGDLLARWTNDRYRSTRHRVRNPVDRERFSAVFFMDLDHHARIEVLPSCVRARRGTEVQPHHRRRAPPRQVPGVDDRLLSSTTSF